MVRNVTIMAECAFFAWTFNIRKKNIWIGHRTSAGNVCYLPQTLKIIHILSTLYLIKKQQQQ